jgi:hypothetical protein
MGRDQLAIASDAGFDAELARLLAERAGRPPADLFAGMSDDLWLWTNTEGRRRFAELGELLPGLPSEDVQRRWTGKAADETLAEGFAIYRTVRELYERNIAEISDAGPVLDFGCGWGRVIRYFLRDLDHRMLTGSDYNESLVEFCRQSNRWCTFLRNEAEPPLPAGGRDFGYVYCYSVFSHFSEIMHLRWLEGLRDALRPGGAVALSVRPREFIEFCGRLQRSEAETEFPILERMFEDADRVLERYDAGEYCYSPYDPSTPDAWWGEACIPRQYIEREWGRLFEVVDFVQAGELRQHFVLLRA